MAAPTDEQIKKWRDRWYIDGNRIKPKIDPETGESYRDTVKRILSNPIGSVEKLREIKQHIKNWITRGSPWKEFKDILIYPVLNLRGLDFGAMYYHLIHIKSFKDSHLCKQHLEGAILSNVNFSNSQFTDVHLEGAELSNANLENTIFESAFLEGANLGSANLAGATFAGANLSNANLYSANLKGTKIDYANLSGACLKGADLTGADLSHSILSEDDRIVEFDYANFNKNTKFFNCDIRAINWTNNRQLERHIMDSQFIKETKKNTPVWAFFWRILADYGRNIWLVLAWALFFMLMFGFLYLKPIPIDADKWNGFYEFFSPELGFEKAGGSDFPYNQIGDEPYENILAPFYASAEIFTNLGISHSVPLNKSAMFWIVLETILGYVMLGALLSVLAVKFARRS